MMGNNENIARAAWGADVPDWILALALACDGASQNKVANQINRSAALVNQLLRKKYNGSKDACEALIRGHFLNAEIACPALGTIGLHICYGWQDKAKDFVPSNPQRILMYKSCARCPQNRTKERRGDAKAS